MNVDIMHHARNNPDVVADDRQFVTHVTGNIPRVFEQLELFLIA